jgi:hypothetical protein
MPCVPVPSSFGRGAPKPWKPDGLRDYFSAVRVLGCDPCTLPFRLLNTRHYNGAPDIRRGLPDPLC